MFHLPLKSAKSGRGFGSAANMAEADSVVEEDGQGDEAGEPEHHGQTLDGKDDTRVVELRIGVPHRYQDQVGERDQRDDGAEEQEGDLRRRAGIPVAAPPVGHCDGWILSVIWIEDAFNVMMLTISCQTENEDCKKSLHDSQGSCEDAALVERHADLMLRFSIKLVCLW